MNTMTMKCGGTTLNPMDSILSFLHYIFAVLCALRVKWTWTVYIPTYLSSLTYAEWQQAH